MNPGSQPFPRAPRLAEARQPDGMDNRLAPGVSTYHVGLRRGLVIGMVAGLSLVVGAPAGTAAGRLVDVVVTLEAPPLARAVASSRVLTTAAKQRRLDLRTASSTSYLASLEDAQGRVASRIKRAIPGARIRWRYSVVLNGFAVTIPASARTRLASIPGVALVYGNVRYSSLLDRSPQVISAPAIWGPSFTSAGNGMKIGVIDDGVDQRHPFFSAQGFAMPAGFPKGQTAFTTAKVIAARAFPPRSPGHAAASRPFDAEYSQHATHVAGIAGGDRLASAAGRSNVSGVAPSAYIGNYKVLTIPTDANVGLDGNAPEIVAGIEAAVRDGMDVINLSLGEPEIEQRRDLVVQAINAAADAGVIPTIAAGNDFSEFGRGSVGSPGSAPKAITAAAVTKARRIADFSSSGPTPLSHQMKPDLSAPGVSILSSIPAPDLWANFSGTSMAAPHVAGAAAVLRQRHPGWTVAQVKSALVLTAEPVYSDAANTTEVPTTRQGGGIINLVRADNPLVFGQPTSISFGFVQPGQSPTRSVQLTDAGGGGGQWSVSIRHQVAGVASVSAPAAVTVPGRLDLTATPAGTTQGEVTGFVVLTRGTETRRLPFWLRANAPALGRAARSTLRRTGTFSGNTRGRRALVDSYRYPDNPLGAGVRTVLRGPEHVFRLTLARAVENFGVAILSRDAGAGVEPRVVAAGDENRLTGYAGLPLNLNPYLTSFLRPALVAGALRPAAGVYDIVFDSPGADSAGTFRFRFWINDQTPPTIRVVSRTVSPGRGVVVSITDAGAGVNPTLLRATIDGDFATIRYSRATGRAVVVASEPLARGRHQLVFRASDYQETKNNENVLRILPNTRRFTAAFTVR